MELRTRNLLGQVRRTDAALLALTGFFFLGGVLGCCCANLLNGDGARVLAAYLQDYLCAAAQERIRPDLFPILVRYLILLLVCTAAGFTALGALVLPILMGVEGFFFNYAIACFYRLSCFSGLLYGGILFFLPALLWLPVLMLLAVPGFRSACTLLRRDARTRTAASLGWSLVTLAAGLFAVCAALEYTVLPELLHQVVRAIL